MLGTMTSDPFISPNLTVAQVLACWPETAAIFLRHRTACVGCWLERFCSLADVAESYSLPLETLLGDLQQCVRTPILPRSEP